MNENQFSDVVLKSDRPVLVEFVATWCGSCRLISPVIEWAAQDEFPDVHLNIISKLDQVNQVGEDEFGYMLVDILKQNKVNNSSMRFDPAARTALAFITLRSDGEREFMFFRNPSAAMLLRETELDINLIKQVAYCDRNTVALVGLDQFITKNVTLTNEKEVDAHPIKAMRFSVSPVVRVAVP